MKEGTGGKKEEDGGKTVAKIGMGDGKNGMTINNPGTADYGQEYCYLLLELIISLSIIIYYRIGCGAGRFF